MAPMDILANVLIVIALASVLITLILGMVQLGKKGATARERSNFLMRYRVITQAVAIGVLFIAFAMKASA